MIVLVGPTAVGKTAASIELAERIGAEIVSADSRCVYRGMDVGTAKPRAAERARVPHHLIDVVDPDQEYSVATFLRDAGGAIDGIRARGRRPIVVGGTGYWVNALLGGGTSAAVPPNPGLRAELADATLDELRQRLRALDPEAAERVDARNPRRLERAIEVVTATGRPFAEARRRLGQSPADRLVVGLTLPRELLYARIDARYDEMIAAGWVEEVRRLLADGYSRDLPAMTGLGYREIVAHLGGDLSLQEAVRRAKLNCHRYARSQYSWFRLDDPTIRWLDPRNDPVGAIERRMEEEGDEVSEDAGDR